MRFLWNALHESTSFMVTNPFGLLKPVPAPADLDPERPLLNIKADNALHHARRAFMASAAASGVGLAAPSLLTRPALAQAPARKLIDVHHHIVPPVQAEALRKNGQDATRWTVQMSLEDMDKSGVATSITSIQNPGVWFGEVNEESRKLARAFNDAANAAHLQYKDRFVGLAALPMMDKDAALDELNRAAKLPGIRGVYLGCNIEGRDFSDPEFLPVFQRIEALGLPVFLHPNGAVGGKRFEPFYLANILGNPFDTTIAACHLIYGGVLDKCPKLEVNLPHAGGAVPMLIGRMDHGYAVRRDVPALPRPPSEYMRRFTYDMIGHHASVVKFLISEVGADRVMLGSDYCLDMGYLKPVQDLDMLELNARDRDQILRGTAARLLKL